MTATVEERLAARPDYRALVRARQRFAWTLTAIMSIIYAGFLLLVAFDKPLLGAPVAGGSSSWAVVAGAALLICPVVLCAVYVARANREFDVRLAAIMADAA